MKVVDIETYKEVIHFYQGCDAEFTWGKEDEKSIEQVRIVSEYNGDTEIWGTECECVPIENVKLILRAVKDMTEDEKEEYHELFKDNYRNKKMLAVWHSPLSFVWLIKKRFDIFRLINFGFAIDANPNNVYATFDIPDDTEFIEKQKRIKNIADKINNK